jgi:hypothetical protein
MVALGEKRERELPVCPPFRGVRDEGNPKSPPSNPEGGAAKFV